MKQVSIKILHLYIIIQRLAVTDDPREKSRVLRELLIYAYSDGSKVQEKAKILSELELKFESIVSQIYEDRGEVWQGNKYSLDNEYVKIYSELMARLIRLEREIIENVSQKFHVPLAIERRV